MEDSGPPSLPSPRSHPAALLEQSRRRLGSGSRERALRGMVLAEPCGGREAVPHTDDVCDDVFSSRTSLRSSLAMIGEETHLQTSSHSERQHRSATPILASQKQHASSPSRLARARRAAVPALTQAASSPRRRRSGGSGTSSPTTPTSPTSPTPIADRALEKSELLLQKLSVSLGLGGAAPLVEAECCGAVCNPRSESRAKPLETSLAEAAPALRATTLPTAPIDADISSLAASRHINADISSSTASWQVTAAMAKGLSELQTRVTEIERAGLPLKGGAASFSPEDLPYSLSKTPLSPTSTKSPGSMSTCFSWCSTPRAASPRAATPVRREPGPSRVVRLASAPQWQALDLATPPSPPMARAQAQRPITASPWRRVQAGPPQPRTPRTPRPRSPTLLRHSVAVTSVYHWYSVSN